MLEFSEADKREFEFREQEVKSTVDSMKDKFLPNSSSNYDSFRISFSQHTQRNYDSNNQIGHPFKIKLESRCFSRILLDLLLPSKQIETHNQ
jgi:hypothetical protein